MNWKEYETNQSSGTGRCLWLVSKWHLSLVSLEPWLIRQVKGTELKVKLDLVLCIIYYNFRK